MAEFKRLTLPKNTQRLLLHVCCAPCSGSIIETVLDSGINFSLFFYNPNIHPEKEYLIRKEECKQFSDRKGVSFVDADYDAKNWFERVKGLEHEPERGARCQVCFDVRLQCTAKFASENGFDVISSSLGISRWKNLDQVNAAGECAAAPYGNVLYWGNNWRKDNGSVRNVEISKREHFYQQEYCGCAFSLRDTNQHRVSKGIAPIEIGKRYY